MVTTNNIIFLEDDSDSYIGRTIKNASADATIAIAIDFESAGEKLTKKSVLKQRKVYIPVDIKKTKLIVDDDTVSTIIVQLNRLAKYDIFGEYKEEISLNIAGNGLYTMNGIYTQIELDEYTFALLSSIINSSDLKVKIGLIRTGGQTGFDEAGAKAGQKLGIPVTILGPKGYKFRGVDGIDISNEQKFKERFL